MIATILAASALAAGAGAATPGELPDRFIAAWNAHDPHAFEALYDRDATWVPVAEERTHGRDAIVAEFAKVHVGGWASHTTIAKKDMPEVRLLRGDTATIFFHMDFIADGKPVPGLERALILVATAKQGRWKIAAGQLTKESPAPAR